MSAEPFYFVKLSVHHVAVHKLILWHLLEFGISLLYRVPGVVPSHNMIDARTRLVRFTNSLVFVYSYHVSIIVVFLFIYRVSDVY